MSKGDLESRLDAFPALKERVKNILNIAENSLGDGIALADDAERQVIQELRQLGNEVLQGWTENRQRQVANDLKNSGVPVHKEAKKK